jgi:YHS domain-containing protein
MNMRKLLASVFCLSALGSVGVVSRDGSTASADDMTDTQMSKDAQKVQAEFDGKCAMAVADGHPNEPGDEKYQASVKGKTYYFCSQEAKDRFMKDVTNNTQKASLHWARAHAVKG